MELIINIDGGSRGNPGPGASAYVIKNTKGQKIAEEGRFFQECTNNQAEFTALEMALEKALELKASSVDIRSDSQLLVRQFLGQYKIKNPQLQIIMADIKSLAAKIKKLNIVHVPREQNKEADALCNITMDKALKVPAKKTAPAVAKPAVPAVAKPAVNQVKQNVKTAPQKTVKKQPAVEQLELFDLNNL